ncbi:NUDIX hydrolase [Zhaonella formicivorans]|uniref:NUDIX domain-containing protein n=1 Tax=Zhaonella formicivorans TaxID=2528593 RepID=UPI0010F34105
MEEQTIHSKTVFRGKVVSLRLEEVQLPDGRTTTREIVEHPGAVAVIPLLNSGEIAMVKQYRKPVGKVLYELPAGKLERGEEPLNCARRELLEETGLTASQITKLLEFYTTPGFSDEVMHLYLATGLEQGEQRLDSDEFLQLERFPLATLLKMVREGQIQDAKTIIGLLWLANKNCLGEKR